MGIYWRYKQSADGFRNLVELLESTPLSRRQKMIDAGMAEDSKYTMDAMKYIMEFDDVVGLPDSELAEVMSASPARIVALALLGLETDKQERFLRCSKPAQASEIKLLLEAKGSPFEISGARVKLITIARSLEKKGLVKTKVIPNAA
jgi:flagellar motor switch protein FliG